MARSVRSITPQSRKVYSDDTGFSGRLAPLVDLEGEPGIYPANFGDSPAFSPGRSASFYGHELRLALGGGWKFW